MVDRGMPARCLLQGDFTPAMVGPLSGATSGWPTILDSVGGRTGALRDLQGAGGQVSACIHNNCPSRKRTRASRSIIPALAARSARLRRGLP